MEVSNVTKFREIGINGKYCPLCQIDLINILCVSKMLYTINNAIAIMSECVIDKIRLAKVKLLSTKIVGEGQACGISYVILYDRSFPMLLCRKSSVYCLFWWPPFE